MAWTLVTDDQFTNADTSTGGAGTTTGIPTGPWTDKRGGVGSIVSNKARTASANNLFTDLMVAPDADAADTRIVAEIAHSVVSQATVYLRVSGNDWYGCYFASNTTLQFAKYVGASFANIGSSIAISPTPTVADVLEIDFSAVADDLFVTLTNLTTATVLVNNQTVTDSALASGKPAFGLNTGSQDWTSVKTYVDGGSPPPPGPAPPRPVVRSQAVTRASTH